MLMRMPSEQVYALLAVTIKPGKTATLCKLLGEHRASACDNETRCHDFQKLPIHFCAGRDRWQGTEWMALVLKLSYAP